MKHPSREQLQHLSMYTQQLREALDKVHRVKLIAGNPHLIAQAQRKVDHLVVQLNTVLSDMGYLMPTETYIDVWVDGSHNPKEPGIAGWGYVGTDNYSASGYIHGPQAEQLAHISGEMAAVKAAILHYANAGFRHITVLHDYEGLALLADGQSQGQTFFTREYAAYIEHWRSRGVIIKFKKVASDENRAHDLAYSIIRRRGIYDDSSV